MNGSMLLFIGIAFVLVAWCYCMGFVHGFKHARKYYLAHRDKLEAPTPVIQRWRMN